MTLIRERGGQEQRGSFSPSKAEETLPGGSAGGVGDWAALLLCPDSIRVGPVGIAEARLGKKGSGSSGRS